MAIAQFDLATASGADLKKALLPLFNPPREPVLVDIPELGYLMIDEIEWTDASFPTGRGAGAPLP
jgi:hypothetical protein